MNTTSVKVLDSFHIGSSVHLSDQHIRNLIAIFKKPCQTAKSVLAGRTAVATTRLNGIGEVVVKYYTRGGFLRHFVKRRYLKWGKIRSRAEFELLQRVRSIGVKAPKPIAYAYRGAMMYKAWLVTEKIKQHQTLAQLSLSDPDLALSLINQVASNICTLIQNKIRHVDLHPGNVLVDAQSNIFLIDFDKARLTRLSTHKLRTLYIDRWKRAISKHRLPDMLWKTLETALLQNE